MISAQGSSSGAVDTPAASWINSSTSLAAVLSPSPPRKRPCPQLLSKQQFGTAAIHLSHLFTGGEGPLLQAAVCKAPVGLCSCEHVCLCTA